MATVHLIDASPYIFRAYFALPSSMKDTEGNPANAVYGFADFCNQLIRDEEPTHLGIAFDASLTTSFRNDLYSAYKAQREPPPPELEAQVQGCRDFARALGAVVWDDERFEADDLVATACHQLAPHAAVVVTGDKDLTQLVSDRVTMFDFAKQIRYGPAEVEEKFGVRPDQIADFLGLAGDSVDNIPGVRGVGPKGAVALLRAFGHLEDVYARIDEVAGLDVRGAKSLQKKLVEHQEMALLSKRLSVAAVDAPLEADLDSLAYRGADPALVDPLMERLGFEGIRARIPRWV